MRILLAAKNLIHLTVFSTPLYLLKFSIGKFVFNYLELLILLAVIACFSKKENRRQLRVYIHMYIHVYILPLFLIIVGLAASIMINEHYRGGLGILKSWFIFPLLFMLAIIAISREESEKEKLLKTLYFSSFFVSLVGLIYFFLGKMTYDGRLSAFYPSPNYLAMFLAPGLVVGIWYLISSIKNKTTKYLDIAVLLTVATAFYLTYSYAAWVSVAIGIAIVAAIEKFNKKKFLWIASFWLLIVFIIISVLAAIQWNNSKFQDLITFNERSSLTSRIMIWKSAVKMALDNPVFGIGPGNFQNKYLEYQKYFPFYLEWAVPQPHNLYLAFWLQAGVLGLISFIAIIFSWTKNLIKKIRLGGDYTLKIILAIMIYVLLHGLMDTTYWKNDLSVIFWTVFALGLPEKTESEKK